MLPIEGRPILTAAQMRAAEEHAAPTPEAMYALMERAGAGVADAVRRLAAGAEVLILCGPGNNGGDGYVAARVLRQQGVPVRVAAPGEPRTDLACRARAGWSGPVDPIDRVLPAPVLVDALFGTGLSRPLADDIAAPLLRLAIAATLTIAVDLPSGVETDTGAILGAAPLADLTLALGALKPAYLLQPAARQCGAVRLLDIGLHPDSDTRALPRPSLPDPGPDSHKFSRGMVGVVRGRMAGAAQLAALAAQHAGAGYVTLLGASLPGEPHALVRRPLTDEALADPRMGALVIGPGLGRDDQMRALLDRALAIDRPLVVDGDALHLVTPERLAERTALTVLTPHAGEFDAMFGGGEGSKLDRARAASVRADAIVVFKGADTVIAVPDGDAVIAGDANDWLSTAGSGDVLAGAIGACLAADAHGASAVCAGVWLHREAARRLGRAFIADQLAVALSRVR